MIPTSWMTDVLAFADDRQTGWSRSLIGATPEQIAKLETLAYCDLPESHKTFLMTMGVYDGSLRLADFGTTSIERLIADYRTLHEDNDLHSFVPPGCILIGTGDPSAGDLLLQTCDSEEPWVARSVDGEIYLRQADSLPHFLFYKAFMNFEFGRIPQRFVYKGSGDGKVFLHNAGRELARLGFEPLWFSDSCRLGAWRDGSAVIVSALKDFPIRFQIASRSSSDLRYFKAEFSKALALKPEQ